MALRADEEQERPAKRKKGGEPSGADVTSEDIGSEDDEDEGALRCVGSCTGCAQEVRSALHGPGPL